MKRKAVAIVIVWGIITVLAMLAISALRLMGNQGAITESSVRRTQAFYTAKAAMVKSVEYCFKVGCDHTTPNNQENNRNPIRENNLSAKVNYGRDTAGPLTHLTKIDISVDY